MQNDIMDIALKLKAYKLMCTARAMDAIYEENRHICKYVHSTSRGHEAIQLAVAFHLKACDYVSPYYRDDCMLLGLGFSPYTLMLQLLARKDDIFSGGREYYAHPSYRGEDKPDIIHQSSATGMQAIPATGIAEGLQYLKFINSQLYKTGPQGETPIVVCSLGDASVTEGEVSEAFQVAVLKKLPIIFLVQDNNWGISVTSEEARRMNAFEYAAGFVGLERISIDGSDFESSYVVMDQVIREVRRGKGPYLVRAVVPLLGHHTSGVRKEFYRSEEDLKNHAANDPIPKLEASLMQDGKLIEDLKDIDNQSIAKVREDFNSALNTPEPEPENVSEHIFAATPVTDDRGERAPAAHREKIMMVDAALYAIREILEMHPEAVVYGQDVGRRLGGVFRETATLGKTFGDHRVYNTAIQEAHIIGSTVGMSAVGVRPIVEVQFADYIYPGLNQLATEVAKSCYLSNGKYPVSVVIRVPCGAYTGGGPYHSASIESLLLSIRGIKIAYPSNAADMKGLMKAAFYDPNPVVMLEHKGLYWSKVPGTEDAKTIEPSADYILPLGKGRIALEADKNNVDEGDSCCVITYGMGVYWALKAAKNFVGRVEVIDLRTLFPMDEELVFQIVKTHGKVLVLTEEQQNNSFAEALAGRISAHCFKWLDAPVRVLGALNLPAVPLNETLEEAMLPNAEKVSLVIRELLDF
ncbi:MAG: tungsten formylmethanofuran dehydrogenase [Chitinophagaceae bacterium]|nr:tungsten formylmethanofuran dehydrogenase [Chitinophagaceae bacterium]